MGFVGKIREICFAFYPRITVISKRRISSTWSHDCVPRFEVATLPDTLGIIFLLLLLPSQLLVINGTNNTSARFADVSRASAYRRSLYYCFFLFVFFPSLVSARVGALAFRYKATEEDTAIRLSIAKQKKEKGKRVPPARGLRGLSKSGKLDRKP